jgi:hypothetical protein
MNGRFLSVADLVARERPTTATYPAAPSRDRRPRALTPATELLNREGVRVRGASAPTEESVHVAKLLRREADLPQRPERKPGRAAAVGSAAVLSGLAIAGLIALKPTTADPNNLAAGSGTEGKEPGTAPASEGDVSPTTSVLKRSSQTDRDNGGKKEQQPAAPQTPDAPGSGNGGIGGGAGAGDGSDAPPDPTKPTPPTDNPAPQPPPSEEPPPTQPPPSTPPPGGGGDDDQCDGLLDPVCDIVGGVLDPVTGSVSGTLDGLTP